jgi:hypothetical protein
MRGFAFHTGHDLDRIDKTQRNQQSRQSGQHKNDCHRVDRLAGARRPHRRPMVLRHDVEPIVPQDTVAAPIVRHQFTSN